MFPPIHSNSNNPNIRKKNPSLSAKKVYTRGIGNLRSNIELMRQETALVNAKLSLMDRLYEAAKYSESLKKESRNQENCERFKESVFTFVNSNEAKILKKAPIYLSSLLVHPDMKLEEKIRAYAIILSTVNGKFSNPDCYNRLKQPLLDFVDANRETILKLQE